MLVADDDPEMLAAVSDAFAGLGYEVATVESGAGLIDRLANDGPFNLIVTDVSMPWMDGLKTLRSIRTAGVTTPVIVMTALRHPHIPSHVRALGSNAILLHKPFEVGELAAAAAQLMESGPRGAQQQP